MNKLSEGIIQLMTSILAAIVVSLYFASRGSGDYTLLVWIIAFLVFAGSGLIVKIMYLLIQWKNLYITNVMIYTLSGAAIWVLLIYFPPVYAVLFEDFTVQRFLVSTTIGEFMRTIVAGAICGLIFYHIYIGLHSLFTKVGNVVKND